MIEILCCQPISDTIKLELFQQQSVHEFVFKQYLVLGSIDPYGSS